MLFMSNKSDIQKLESRYKTLDLKDIKGAYDIRNFIAHDYEGINLSIIENVIRDYLPKIKKVIQE